MSVIEFNPWQLSGTGNIASSFFTELGIALRRDDDSSATAARGEKLERYAKRLSIGGAATEAFGAALAMIGLPGSPLVKLAGEQLKKIAEVTKEGGETLKGEAVTESMSDLKQGLSESLRTLKKPLLVVIDDMDRLTTDEVREVLQLVKANADFPNLIYLLLCERTIVAGALDGISGGRGDEFLEKIVQVSYNVPRASRQSLEGVLFHGIDEIIKLPGVSKRWDQERWGDLYTSGLSVYFQSLRHVYRFLGSFAFHVRQFHHGEQFEVNPIDLISLETLRVFEPLVYERLFASKSILTRNEGLYGFGSIKQDVVDATIAQLMQGVPEGRIAHVENILKSIFPPIQSAYNERLDVIRDQPSWLRQARVCHPDLFTKYFTIAIAENDISQFELDRLVGLVSDSVRFAAECEALAHRGLLDLAFERLDAFKDEIPPDSLPAFIRALCDLSDTVLTVNANRTPFSAFDTVSSAARLVYFGLRGQTDVGTRANVLGTVFAESPGVFLPIRIVSMLEVGTQEGGPINDALLPETEISRLRALCLTKIRKLAEDGALRVHPHSIAIYHRWRAWALDEAQHWLDAECVSPVAAAWLLSALMSSSTSGSGTRYYLDLSNVANYADINGLTNLTREIALDELPEFQRTAVKEFRRAIKRQADGKPKLDSSSIFNEEV